MTYVRDKLDNLLIYEWALHKLTFFSPKVTQTLFYKLLGVTIRDRAIITDITLSSSIKHSINVLCKLSPRSKIILPRYFTNSLSGLKQRATVKTH